MESRFLTSTGTRTWQPKTTHLRELRLLAEETRLAARVALGAHHRAIPDLQRLRSEHPLGKAASDSETSEAHDLGRYGAAAQAMDWVRSQIFAETARI